ncbi:tripartite tricarboxylate transporter TctB family protein [Cohnella sp. CFH 77786]|uniref:tripartite tricarboxylate transporter TctB family protein n=1 Tax=Cohnella sp. CFH 77786 TaxID=2662265 RepID=UPI001C60E8C3|nr:tripartite tricarboxylate transporter TctB family protein [Cohnella sp. CFH 77786]MBW5448071.1 tripartite tricarboxylate transporter TctB family protein [Cohnella sp. CFH 77786]
MNRTFDRYGAVAFLAIGTLFVIESRKITTSAYGSNVGSDIFPFYLGIILVLLSIRLFYETFRYAKSKPGKEKEKLDYKRFFIIFGSAVLYAYFMEDIGYVISTFVFLLIGFQTMNRGKIWVSALIAAIFSYGLYYLFVEILKGTLPGFPSWLGLS